MDKPSPFKFSSLEIRDKGGLVADRTLDAEALASLGADAPFAGPVNVRLEFFIGESDVLLQGTATGKFSDTCARCLVPVTPEFTTILDQVYPKEVEDIDVSGELREAVMIVIPEKAVCKPDCKGLCVTCGQNLNEKDCGHKPAVPDSFNKFAKLKELKKEKKP